MDFSELVSWLICQTHGQFTKHIFPPVILRVSSVIDLKLVIPWIRASHFPAHLNSKSQNAMAMGQCKNWSNFWARYQSKNSMLNMWKEWEGRGIPALDSCLALCSWVSRCWILQKLSLLSIYQRQNTHLVWAPPSLALKGNHSQISFEIWEVL